MDLSAHTTTVDLKIINEIMSLPTQKSAMKTMLLPTQKSAMKL
jgi:hypothetical protein